jgi:hypothetical protein
MVVQMPVFQGQPDQQQAWGGNPAMAGMLSNLPLYWGYAASAASRPYEAWAGMQGQFAQADANRYASELGLEGLLSSLPWQHAGTVQQSTAAADAAKQVGLYNMLGSVYPAAYQAWAQYQTDPEVARIQADASKYGADAATEAAGLGAYGNIMSSYYPAAAGLQAAAYGPVEAGIAADAAKYGSQQSALANMMAAYYPSQAGIEQAQIGAGASNLAALLGLQGQGLETQAAQNIAGTQAGAQRDVARTQAGAEMGTAGIQAGAGRDIAATNVAGQLGQAQIESEVARYIAQLQQQQALASLLARQGGLETILGALGPLLGQGAPAMQPITTNYGAGYG